MHQKMGIRYRCGCSVILCFDVEKNKDPISYPKHPNPNIFFCSTHQKLIDSGKKDMKTNGPIIMGPDY